MATTHNLPIAQDSRINTEGWMLNLTASNVLRSAHPEDPASVAAAIRFLLQMSKELEQHGNYLESVKCAEAALVLRRANETNISKLIEPLISEGLMPATVSEAAAALVLRCNSHAVDAFNNRRFDVAEVFLGRALFLTDTRGAEAVDYFSSISTSSSSVSTTSAPRRLRLRAATFNNLGCMERRRGRLPQSLAHLRQALELEATLDPTARGSPSTYLNLCTVLNEMQRHHEAVTAAESAIAALQEQIPEQSKEQLPGAAMMLVVGMYNLGVSLERRGRDGDKARARTAYQGALEASRKYFVDSNCPTVELAMSAIKRMHAAPTFRSDRIALEGAAAAAASSSQSYRTASGSQTYSITTQIQTQQQEEEKHYEQEYHEEEKQIEEKQVVEEERQELLLHHSYQEVHQQQQEEESKKELEHEEQVSHHQHQFQIQMHHEHQRVTQEEKQEEQQQKELETQKQEQSKQQAPPPPPPPPRQEQQQTARVTRLTPLVKPSDQGEETWAQRTQASETYLSVGYKSNSTPLGSFTQTVPGNIHTQKRPSVSGPLTPLISSNELNRAQSVPVPGQISIRRGGSGILATRVENSSNGNPLPLPLSNSQIENKKTIPRPAILSPIRRSSESLSGTLQTPKEGVRQVSLIASLGPKSSGKQSVTSSPSLAASTLNPFGRRMFGSISVPERQGSANSSIIHRHMRESESLALEKHLQRSQLRQAKVEEAKKKSSFSGRRGSALTKAKEREQKRLAKEEAARDAAMADALYEKLVYGMRAEEMYKSNRAATLIQRTWRGCLARTLLRRMIVAAKKIQRVFRIFLIKLQAARRAEEERLARIKAAREKQETEAAIVLQIRVRQFLKRLEIRRAYLGRKMRRHYAARTIQRGFRAFLKWREEHIAALMEAQRLEDERKLQIAMNAARKIQWAFKRHKKRKQEIEISKAQQRRERAAAIIQAQVRGVLARAWFRYYKSYRREQELKSAVNQKRIIMIQSASRVLLALKIRRAKEVDLMRRIHQHQLNKAATKIQCQWRSRVARIKLERLYAERDMKNRRAIRIQRWYATCVLRRRFLQIREVNRRKIAAKKIQRWYHECKMRIKENEMARYYADLARRQRLAQLQAKSVVLLQSWGRWYVSSILVRSVRSSFLRFTLYAEGFQRIARGFTGRLYLFKIKYRKVQAARLRVEYDRQTQAACIIQRAWRCAMAKDTVEQMRRRVIASICISKHYRGYLCRKELKRLRAVKQLEKETHAAIIIQRIVRQFLQRLELVRLDVFYRKRRQKKLIAMRREEAVTTLQAAWRGRATRKALEKEKEALNKLAVYAIKIQRAWRTRKFRKIINIEVAERTTIRMGRTRAALKIQCFWRKMMAAEKVARLRVENKIRSEKALIIQCWWRCILAKFKLYSLRVEREEELALRLHYMSKWDTMVTIINAELRVRLSQQLLLVRKRKQLLNQLTDIERERFLSRHQAATKIQAIYRGHYERVYARGIRKQKEEEERRRRLREELEKRSAIIIQCAYRVWKAKCEVNALRIKKREKHLAEELEHCTTIDPHELVRQIFWVHESSLKRDLAKERLERSNKRLAAASLIQKMVRRWLAKRLMLKIRREAIETRAVKTIQRYWNQYRESQIQRELEKQCEAAVKIQAHFRGYRVRRHWEQWREEISGARQLLVMEEEIYDQAATTLQSFWRRLQAMRRAQQLRKEREEKQVQKMLDEAASTIQRAYRSYRLRCLVGKQ